MSIGMRKFLVIAWCLVPVGVAAYHYGPGQDQMARDGAAAAIREAQAWVGEEDYASAAEAFERALATLPDSDRLARYRIRLEKANAQMLACGLPTAHGDLGTLLEDVSADPSVPTGLVADVRTALANSQFYMAWLLRLEGHGRETWSPEIEASRQNFRLLAEAAEDGGDVEGSRAQRENLEASIKLARMDLGELQGLPLPSQ
ncbi:hypothetical protein BH23VER1_BH23VER1_07630 [soil metagenome]